MTQWFNIIGLILDIIGAAILTSGLIVLKKKAVELGVTRLSSLNFEENLQTIAVKERLRQPRNAFVGLAFLVVGFILQIIGNWPG